MRRKMAKMYVTEGRMPREIDQSWTRVNKRLFLKNIWKNLLTNAGSSDNICESTATGDEMKRKQKKFEKTWKKFLTNDFEYAII